MSKITGPRNYDGVISRQELVNHCQDTANKMYQELLREEALLENTKDMSDDQYETLTFSKQNIIGHIAALREITEWAKAQVEVNCTCRESDTAWMDCKVHPQQCRFEDIKHLPVSTIEVRVKE